MSVKRGTRVFSKPALPLTDQLGLLKSRGLHVSDDDLAIHRLKMVGYYRLAIYCRPFQADPDHDFLPDSDFETVWSLYVFDRKLRLLVLDAVERIEVAFRTVLNNHMSLSMDFGPNWYENPDHFRGKKEFDHTRFMLEIRKASGADGGDGNGRAPFCRAYYENYATPELPPCWMVSELLPIGSWSRAYSALSNEAKRSDISKQFNSPYGDFGNWIFSVACVRNVAAHHSLLWNATLAQSVRLNRDVLGDIPRNNKFYAHACVIAHLLKTISFESLWGDRLATLLESCPLSFHDHMAFPDDWRSQPPWIRKSLTSSPDRKR